MNLLQAFILGIVEGITEFLPISSTGHLILTSKAMGLPQTEFLKSFEVAIQVGAILAVLVLYGRRVLLNAEVFKRVCVAFIPTAVIGALLYKFIKQFLLSNHIVVLWSLLIGGIVLIAFELIYREGKEADEDLSRLSYRKAFLIGAFQSLAMIPGVSRAGATIIGGLVLGLKRKSIVEFSFLLAIPTMLAATALDLLKSDLVWTNDQAGCFAVGLFSSFAVAIISIKFLLHYIQKHNFNVFGIYRIVVALCGFLFLK